MSGTSEYDRAYDDYTSEEYPPDWKGRRKEVLARDDYTCRDCGVTSTRVDGIPFDVDHIVPKSDGGSHALSNLQTLCRSCHADKHPDNTNLARRARKWQRRNTRSLWVRLLRVLLVVPLLFDLLSGSSNSSRTITDEHGRRLELAALESVPNLPVESDVSLEARVATLWESSSQSIQQVGLLAPTDSTHEDDVTTKFVVWADNGLPEMRENDSYRLIGARTDEYNGRAEVVLDGRSEIRSLS
jgi:hypothetical protein